MFQRAGAAWRRPDVTKRVVAMLETVYFYYRVPAWSRNLTAKAKRSTSPSGPRSGPHCRARRFATASWPWVRAWSSAVMP